MSGSSCINMHWFSLSERHRLLELETWNSIIRRTVSCLGFTVPCCCLLFVFPFLFCTYKCIRRSIFHVDQLQNGWAQYHWMVTLKTFWRSHSRKSGWNMNIIVPSMRRDLYITCHVTLLNITVLLFSDAHFHLRQLFQSTVNRKCN